MTSETTLPPPRCSSAVTTIETGIQSDPSSSEGDFDTSLDSSTCSGTNEENRGDREGRLENKQKRKRTSPADQAVLESEYRQNPKPNKAARADIVEKVSLNEKEVQIWFQNRRQINRRKSRPLLPHEIAAFGLGGMAAFSSDSAPAAIFSSSQPSVEQRPSSQEGRPSSREDTRQSPAIEVLDAQVGDIPFDLISGDSGAIEEDNNVALPSTDAMLKRQSSAVSIDGDALFSSIEDLPKSFSSTPGNISNRWIPTGSSFSTPALSQTAIFATPEVSHTAQPSSCPERIDSTGISPPSSQIRLSMSLDGKAELVTTSPSPPRVFSARPSSPSGPQKRMRGLQRSQSALGFGPYSATTSSIAPFAPRLRTGRSRDARSWEFCCDADARDELTTLAENESNGSAVAAISLLRSTSSSTLKPNKNKRNALAIKSDLDKHSKKPKLGRATSSLARLQSTSKSREEDQTHGKDGLPRSPSGDSDKENWLPHENAGNLRRRPLPSARSRSDKQINFRTILGDNHNILTHAGNLGGGNKNRKKKSANIENQIFEDRENGRDVGGDVEKFMRGEISPSKKGDLDCVQGLLSLSQGNWR